MAAAGVNTAVAGEAAKPDLRLAGAAGAVWLVTWCCLIWPVSVAATMAALGTAGAALALLVRRRAAAGTALVLVGVAAAGVGTGLQVWARDASPLAMLARSGSAVTIRMVVTDDPRPVARPRAPDRRRWSCGPGSPR